MTPHDITEGLTAAEARCALHAFLTAVERNDAQPDADRFLRDLQGVVALIEGLALGTITAIDDGRCRLTVTDLQAIRDSNESSYQLALQLNVPASTVRAARQRLREAA
jgi:hypothetical protein